MKTRLAAALAAMAALLAAGLVGLAAPAQATENEPVCATWKMRGATGPYPAVVWAGPPEGSSVSKFSAKLVKPQPPEGADPLVQPGVEFAAFDLEVQAPADNEIHVGVDFALADEATWDSGAVRLFGYKIQGANTVTVAPDYGPDVVTGQSGHLTFKIPAGEKLGTLGLVYDASNSNPKGSVTFSDLEIDGRPVQFTECVQPEPTQTATPGPTQTAEPGATPEPSGTAAPVPSLPVTGSTPWMFALAGLCALGAGGLLYWLSRRRSVQFRA